MRAVISGSKLEGIVTAIPSKSFAHRYLLAAALSSCPTKIEGIIDSADVKATCDCLVALGCSIEHFNDYSIMITPPKEYNLNAIYNCNESGSTSRMLVPILCALGVGGLINAKNGLTNRPMDSIIECLRDEIVFSANKLPFNISGKMAKNSYILDPSISSQFVSGMLFALAYLDNNARLVLSKEPVSQGYIDITLSVLKRFGIDVKYKNNTYIFSENSRYVSPKCVKVEGDWSNSAFWLVAGALCGNLTINNLDYKSVQSSAKIVNILKTMGTDIDFYGDQLFVKKSDLHGANIDARDIPDEIPVLCVAASFAKGITTIKGVDRLRIKECDRLSASEEMLSLMGISWEYKLDTLTIYGGKPTTCSFNGHNDHRMVMAQSVAALAMSGESIVDDIMAVNKSYPTFFEELTKLGGNIHDYAAK